MKSSKNVYVFSLLCIVVMAIYPLFMGGKTIFLLIQNGSVKAEEYERYIIPYAPIAISLVFVFAFYQLIRKLAKRYALPISTVIGYLVFFASEIFFEKIEVFFKGSIQTLDDFQSLLCYRPAILDDLLFSEKSISYKVHFYLISLAIIAMILCLLDSLYRFYADQDTSRKKPFFVSLVCTFIFIGLCILTNFTSFFRTSSTYLSPASAILTSLFFITFSLCMGMYFACIFFGKRKTLSIYIPIVITTIMCLLMYVGEMSLLGGDLYRFGGSFMFQPFLSQPLAPIDIIVIIISTIASFLLLKLIYKKKQEIIRH